MFNKEKYLQILYINKKFNNKNCVYDIKFDIS